MTHLPKDRSHNWLQDVRLDLLFALRTSIRRPAFTAVAALTLALGIGAATAVFSFVNAVLLRPLPYRDPGRLVAVWITSTREMDLAKLFATHADFAAFRNARSFASVSAATWAARTTRVLSGVGTTRNAAREILTIPASASLFETLGVPAAIGRTFRGADEQQGCSIVAAHQFWASTLGADASIVGKSVTLDQTPCTLLGVMPQDFSFYPRQTQAWILLGPSFQPDQDRMLTGIFARLQPGVTIPQAQSELRSLYRAIHPAADPRVEARDFQPVVYDLHGEFTFLAGRTLRTTLILLFGAVLLVLLIACLNVANLLLARLSERRREMAVRAALGSGQARLVRQVLTEGLLLSGFGTALGVVFAYTLVRFFRLSSPIELSAGTSLAISLPVLAFSGLLSILTTLTFALLPALRASRVDFIGHLKAVGRGSVHGRHRLARTVIAVEMAFSFLLLTGAGLLIMSALRMGSEPLGFHPDHVQVTRVSLPVYRYSTDTQRLQLYDRLLERLSRLPATDAALASKVPPEAGGNQILLVRGGTIAAGSEIHEVGADAVTPGFFDVLRIPLLQGRLFHGQDRENSQPVAIVNQSLAERYFPNATPIGRQIRIPGGQMPWLTVVGVVGNLKHTQLMNEMSWVESPIFYRPLAQEPRQSVQIVVRAAGNPASAAQQIQSRIAALDPSIPQNDFEPIASRLAKTLAYPRFRAAVLAFFAICALLLSAVGLHGVLSQLVARRIPELGVRRALGAQTHQLLLLIARQGGAPVLAGLATGILLTLAFSRILANLLYGIQPTNPRVLAAVALVLFSIAITAILFPAARAARVDPMAALRDE